MLPLTIGGNQLVPLTLANRCAVAAELWRRSSDTARLVLSGADVSRVGTSEAQAMKAILTSSHGIPSEALLLDELAVNTIEPCCSVAWGARQNIFEAEGAGALQIEACPAFSGLSDDISDDPAKDDTPRGRGMGGLEVVDRSWGLDMGVGCVGQEMFRDSDRLDIWIVGYWMWVEIHELIKSETYG
eukprot:Skav230764  [mRNA]  locus=scaffold4732:30597:37341:+ [translate_table: standard]